MAKEYKDATPKEKYDSAVAKDKEAWNPGEKLLEFIASKTGADKPVPPTPPKGLKKGGSVKKCKCMARGGGCEVRGKTKGRFV